MTKSVGENVNQTKRRLGSNCEPIAPSRRFCVGTKSQLWFIAFYCDEDCEALNTGSEHCTESVHGRFNGLEILNFHEPFSFPNWDAWMLVHR